MSLSSVHTIGPLGENATADRSENTRTGRPKRTVFGPLSSKTAVPIDE